MNILFLEYHYLTSDRFLNRILPIIKLTISPLGFLIWFSVLLSGIKLSIDNFSELNLQSQSILSPSNIILLYISVLLIKMLHELGHSFAVKRFGGEVHTIGLMFLIFNPLPYMDASAAWSFRNKWHRVFVGLAGMITEIFTAACAAIIWANTGPGLVHSICYNLMFIASISTIIFNINPLLRFDGYYILSDLRPPIHQ